MARVLIFFEDPESVDVPAIVLANDGHEVLLASVATLVPVLERQSVDVVLVEAHLAPDLARCIQPLAAKPPVVVMAADAASQPERFGAYQLGVVRVVPRPLAVRSLLAAVQHAVYFASTAAESPVPRSQGG